MSHYRRVNIPGETHFFTGVTYRKRPFLCDSDIRASLRTAIQNVQTQYPYPNRGLGIVVRPYALHLDSSSW